MLFRSVKNNKNKGQEQVKNMVKIICFKCKEEGHHVRSCSLKKKPLSVKQKGKQPQVLPQASKEGISKLKEGGKRRTCYVCRDKGHISSSCTKGNSSKTILINDAYSLCKDEVGNVFAKYVGTQCGFKKRTIWVIKPIVTNFLGPNLVGDQQAKT